MGSDHYPTRAEAIAAAWWDLALDGGGRLYTHRAGCTTPEAGARCACRPQLIIVPAAAIAA